MKWAFLMVLVAEFLLFDRMTSLHYARIYPRWHDQIQPLTESYTGYEYAQENGFWSGIGHTLAKPAAQGDLHSLWAILVFEAAGRPSRSAALAVNMLAFLAWQAALVLAIKRGTDSQSLAWMAVGLTLALRWPWSDVQGSATDFRLDHVSMCMMGISLAAALRTDGFRSTGWSGVFGVAVGMTLLTRFLAGTYFAVILGACVIWTLLSPERSRRVPNLGLAAALAAVAAGPCLWLNRQAIYEHYWIGHYFDPNGVLWSSHLSFAKASARLVAHLCAEQLGAAFVIASGLAIFVLAGGLWSASRRPSIKTDCGKYRWTAEAATLGAIFLFAPALVLALQNNDRMVPVVLGVSVPGAVVLVLALCNKLRAEAAGRVSAGAAAKLSMAAALIALAVGVGYFVVCETAAPFDPAFAADAREVDAVADKIFATVHSNGIDQPRIAVDQVADYMDGVILPVICYERHLVWVPFIMELPTGISAVPEQLVIKRLGHSDFLVATENGPPGPWPYDQQMYALRPKILAWCNAHLRLVQRFTVSGQRMVLYQRREIGMAPLFVSPPVLLGSTKGDFDYHLKVASGHVRYDATDLPAGLELDGASGWIRGRLIHAGPSTARITATNSMGSTSCDFTFRAGDSTFFASVNAPKECTAGVPVEVPYEAFDARAELNFIDVTDLTTGKQLDRLNAEAEEQQTWQGRYIATFSQPGMHSISLRFVRFDPGNKNAYTFIDRIFDIRVLPAPFTVK